MSRDFFDIAGGNETNLKKPAGFALGEYCSMSTSEPYFDLIRTSKSSWVAVPINRQGHGTDGTIYTREPDSSLLRNEAPAPGRLFARAAKARDAFPERFPRLVIVMIAASLLAVSVTAEIEYLRHAGYFWN